MLFNEQIKVEKELQRKIDKLRTENKDPSLPQKPAYAQPRGIPATPSFDMGTHSPRAVPSPPPYARGRMMDSHATVDESFMVLGGRVRSPIRICYTLVLIDQPNGAVRSWRRLCEVLGPNAGYARHARATFSSCLCHCTTR